MVSLSGILVKILVTSIVENKTFSRRICILNLRNKRKSIFPGVIISLEGRKKIAKKMGKLKVPIDETIGQILGNQSLEENLYILGVP